MSHPRSALLTAALAALGLLAASCGGPQVPGTLTSGKQEFYNAGCDGLIFDARVDKGKISILSVATGEDQENKLGHFIFDLDKRALTTNKATDLIVDVDPPAESYLKGTDNVCFVFGPEDQAKHTCFESLVSNGAFCMKVDEDGEVEPTKKMGE